jgi:hypothetical protein
MKLGDGFSSTSFLKPTALRLPHTRVPLYCSTFKFDFADKIYAGDEKHLIIHERLDR